ncbi:hypothetical protein [Thermococcus peptonophilus]|nr:hypothetical protein [Thermococcus peptonophilus]
MMLDGMNASSMGVLAQARVDGKVCRERRGSANKVPSSISINFSREVESLVGGLISMNILPVSASRATFGRDAVVFALGSYDDAIRLYEDVADGRRAYSGKVLKVGNLDPVYYSRTGGEAR